MTFHTMARILVDKCLNGQCPGFCPCNYKCSKCREEHWIVKLNKDNEALAHFDLMEKQGKL